MKHFVTFIALSLLLYNANAQSGESYSVGLNNDLGGYVLYVTPNGKHGLVVTTQDQGISNWYGAAGVVSDPENHDAAGKNFTDWRLPTDYELELIYRAKDKIGGFEYEFYWSSMARDAENASGRNFTNGEFEENLKRYSNHGSNASRAVRSF